MKQSKPTQKQQPIKWWRPLLSGMLVALATVAVVSGLTARYIRDNVINTDGYLAIVGPLPQHPDVAKALSTYATDQVFDTTNAEQNIKEALPPKLAPLAAPLATTLQNKVQQTTQNFVTSDNFTSIWTATNRASHDAVVRLAESKEGETRLEQGLAKAESIDMSRLLTSVRERVGSDKTLLTDEQKDNAAAVRVNLEKGISDLRTSVQATKTAANVLPYLSVALLLGAVAVAYNRRRTVLGIGILSILLAASMIITFKLWSGAVLDDFHNDTYRAAAEAIYQAFYRDLDRRLTLVMWVGIILSIIALLAGPYGWAKRVRGWLYIPQLKKSKPYKWLVQKRSLVLQYEWAADLTGAGIVLVALLIVHDLKPSDVVVALSLLGIFIAFMHIIARPAPVKRQSKR